MKPFIKPVAAVPDAPAPAPAPRISPNELTIFSVAATMGDAAERAAYIERACAGDAAMRVRLEQRLAARGDKPTPVAPMPAEMLAVRESALAGRPDALALVPMSAMQFAAAQQPPRHSPIPWAAATLLAIAVGALAVFFFTEKKAREKAEGESREALAAKSDADRERDTAMAAALEAKTIAQRTQQQGDEAARARDAAAADAKRAREEAAASRADAESAKAATAAEAAKVRAEAAAKERTATAALADSLAKLAAMQLDGRSFADAEANARQCLDLRMALAADAWSLVEARGLLGAALLQRNQDAEAEKLLVEAGTQIGTLGLPASDADRARFAVASKRIVQFFSATGRRREAAEWKRKLEVVSP